MGPGRKRELWPVQCSPSPRPMRSWVISFLSTASLADDLTLIALRLVLHCASSSFSGQSCHPHFFFERQRLLVVFPEPCRSTLDLRGCPNLWDWHAAYCTKEVGWGCSNLVRDNLGCAWTPPPASQSTQEQCWMQHFSVRLALSPATTLGPGTASSVLGAPQMLAFIWQSALCHTWFSQAE